MLGCSSRGEAIQWARHRHWDGEIAEPMCPPGSSLCLKCHCPARGAARHDVMYLPWPTITQYTEIESITASC
ncbi:hypothetical protein BGW80DRAFT_1331335 [Lactifluus volemus]|nr:hypothetical protein BGW80DRAFT_1331335 [Lactifluus volemus]